MTNATDEFDDFLEEGNHRWRKRLIMATVVVAAMVAGLYALWTMVLHDGGSAESAIQTTTVQRGAIANTISTSATTASQSTANLSFGTSGKVTAVNVAVGQEVKEGDVLAEVEATTLQDAVTRAQVNLSSAQTKLNDLLEGSTAAELASADQSVIQAQSNLDKAQSALDDLYDGPTTEERDTAQQGVLNAESQLAKAETARADIDTDWEDAVDKAEEAVEDAEDALSEAEASGDQDAIDKAEEALETAEDNLDDLGDAPDPDDIAAADMAIESAELSLKMANDKLAELDEPPSDEDVRQAQYNVDSAAASLTAAEAKRDEAYRGAEDDEITTQQDQVRLAQLSVNEAKEDLEKAQIIAPFDGTVAALNISVGETVGSGSSSSSSSSSSTAAIVLNTPNALVLNLSIGESDLLSVEVGQTGTATFDAISGRTFPIVIDSIGTNATTTQGVVTYQAKAHIVEREMTAQMQTGSTADRLEGMDEEQRKALAERLGVDSSDTQALQEAIAQQAASAAAAAEEAASIQPVPGMNATVTLVIDQAQDVLYVPDSAIQAEGPTEYVTVQKEDGSTEKVTVQTGLSDGSNTEVSSGLEEGQTVIIPAATAASSSSSQVGQGNQFFGGGIVIEGGGPPGGGPSFNSESAP